MLIQVMTTEFTEWQWPLSGEHSIMMVKSAQPDDGGSTRPPPFTLSTITNKKLWCMLPLFILYPYMYSVVVITAWFTQVPQLKLSNRT
jgi:hypothetical protein